MVSKVINKLPKSQVEVTITVPWADIAPKWDHVLQRLSQEIELSGFRKGQAPTNLVEQQLGSKLTDEVLKEVFPQSLVEALQGTDIVPIDYPKYQLVSFVKGQQLVFKALVTERPKVSVGNYKTVKTQRPLVKQVSDEDVNKVIQDLFKRWTVRQAGKPSSPQPVASGSGSMNFNATTSAQPPQVPTEPNDQFAQNVGAQNLQDLKNKIKQDLESEAKYNNELDFEEAILQEIEKMTNVDVPDVLVQDELNRMLVSLQRRVTEMGLLFDDYLKSQGKTVEGLKNEWRVQAEKNMRMELGLSEIARAENVNISDEELQAEIDKISDNRIKMQFETQEPRLHLKHALRQTKTLDLLKKMVGG